MELLQAGETFGVVGAGVMGRTIIQGVIDSGVFRKEQIWASAKSEASCALVRETLGVEAEPNFSGRVAGTGILAVCVKPGQAVKVLPALRAAGLRKETLLISILAGTGTEQLEGILGTENPWVRAMPNTPCVVREGMTVVCGGRYANGGHLATAKRIFESVGVCLAADEQYFNAVTALSGSGPAYQYLIMEAMADAGVRVGLPRQLALTLVTQTAVGAARMVQTSGRHPAALRDDVTTPAGCTIGGLLMLEDGKIRSVLARAIEEATRIASHLGPAKKS